MNDLTIGNLIGSRFLMHTVHWLVPWKTCFPILLTLTMRHLGIIEINIKK